MPLTKREIRSAKRGIRSWSKRRRAEAVARIGALRTEEAAQVLVTLFRYRRRHTYTGLALNLIALLPMLLVAFMGDIKGDPLTTFVLQFFAVLMLGIIPIVQFAEIERMIHPLPKAVLPLLHSIHHPSLIPPLLETHFKLKESYASALSAGLLGSIATLSEEQFFALDSRHRRSLYFRCASKDARQQTAAIAAVLGFNDVEAIPTLRRMLKWRRTPTVAEPLKSCLDQLMEYRDSQPIGTTLLRASTSSDSSTMLRAAGSSAEVGEELQLLHPSDKD